MDNSLDIITHSSKILGSIWNHGILTIAQNKIAVGNLAIASLIFFFGIKYYKIFLNWLNNKLIKNLDADKDTINILENLIFYSLWGIFLIIIMQLANIPLSIFAFIGGAFAISLGLGAQTFISNFIASLVVMIERPLKIGDIVQIGSIFGTVKSVGIRNTVITSPSDLEVLIPNTIIVNSTLINWTLNDSIIKYRMIFRTKRNNTESFTQVEQTINKLQYIINHIEFSLKNNGRKIKLIKISDKHFSFLMEFYVDIKNIEEFESIKSTLNLILLKEFENTKFFIEYTKDTELKTTTI